jgi:cobalt-zinc-cadmium efflux system membrane fusion protein
MRLLIALLVLLAACGKRIKHDDVPPEDELWIGREAFERGSRVAEAGVRELPQSISTGGRIAFDDLRVSHVFSPVTGRVTRVLAQLGEKVVKGSALAAIVSPDVGTANSDLVKARADLAATERDFHRQEKLREAGAGSSRDFEAAEDAYRKARAEEERALQRLRTLRAGRVDSVTQEYTLPSQIEGRVIARMVNPGMEVQGQFSGGTAVELFTVGSIDSVILTADVGEADLPLLELGANVSVRVLAYPDRAFTGKVEWISSTLDPALRTARIRCSLPNADGALKPEMYASVVIERPAVARLAVPAEAITRINDQSFVYVKTGERKDGKQIFKRRHIRTPDRDGAPQKRNGNHREVPALLPALPAPPPAEVPILEGLKAGEQVLIDSHQILKAEPEDTFLTAQQLRSGKITVVVAQEQDVSDAITIGGRLTFDDLRVTHVFPPVNGRIQRVVAALGQRVRRGDPLAVLVSPDLGSAFSDELKAKADLIQAEHEVKRQRELYAVRASAQKDLEQAEGNFAKARAEYQRAQQKTRLLQQGQSDSVSQEFVLRSPIDGEVIARSANPGVEVQGAYSGSGNVVELFTIGSIEDLWLMGDVYETDLPYVKRGAEVDLTVSIYPGRTFLGRVDWISDTVDPVLRTAKVRCVLKNQKGLLRPEMYEVVNVAAPPRHALTIPRDALLRLGDETDVFVEMPQDKDGRIPFRRKRVIANEQFPGKTVPVLAGLQPGERVAASGSIFLIGN